MTTMTDVRADAEQDVAAHVIALHHLAKSTIVAFARRLHPDLHPLGYGVLRHIMGADAGVRSGEIAIALGIDKSSVSRQVAFLREVGLVETRPDPLDGRASLLVVSARARAQVESFRDGTKAEYERVFAEWETDDVADLARLLGRFVTSAGPAFTSDRVQ